MNCSYATKDLVAKAMYKAVFIWLALFLSSSLHYKFEVEFVICHNSR